jgi:hypothetical protein
VYRVDQRVFIVRVWREVAAARRGRLKWHASATDAVTREIFEFSSASDLARFLGRGRSERRTARRQRGIGEGTA